MKLSTSWIKNSLGRTISDRELADALESAGIEVEQLTGSQKIDQLVVVGNVKKCVQHPNADRLRLCEVQVSDDGPLLQIVCGAPNVREGLNVAVALVGATLPGGDTITEAKLRGEVSHGMLCSGRELGLSDDHDGLIELANDLAIGTPLSEVYPVDGQIEFKTAANRPDLLNIEGLVNEIAAQLKMNVEFIVAPVPESLGKPEVTINSDAAKHIVLAELILGEGSKDSLRTYQGWLRTSNVRSISPVVDITNIAMLQVGQPLHAYDADKVQGVIVARQAQDGESLVTLDGKKRALSSDDLVIADDSGVIGLAGVMGGQATEVSPSTRRIYLEAATFDGVTIRKAAQRHKLRSEASARFERGLPLEFAGEGLMFAVGLLQEHVEAELVGVNSVGEMTSPKVTVTLEANRLQRLVGSAITLEEAAERLSYLNYDVGTIAAVDRGTLTVGVPYWRPDVRLQEDVIEDLVRLVGYDNIPATLPTWQPQDLQFDTERVWRNRLRDVLYACGLFEVYTYSFVSADQIEHLGEKVDEYLALENPMSQEQAYLRRSPLPSLLATLARNDSYRAAVGCYEMTSVFEPTKVGELPHESDRLAVIWQGRSDTYTTLKGVYDEIIRVLQLDVTIEAIDDAVMAPGRSGEVMLKGVSVGRIGQLAPAVVRAHRLQGEVAYFELDIAALIESAKPINYVAPSKFPVARRDLAIVVPQEITWQAVAEALSQHKGVSVRFLNDYYGNDLPLGHKSMAMRIEMSASDHTLTDREVEDSMHQITNMLASQLKAQPR